jgi:hypothetical protein
MAMGKLFVKCSVQAHFVTTGHISTRGSPPISDNTDANIRNKPIPLFIPKGKKPEPVIALFFVICRKGGTMRMSVLYGDQTTLNTVSYALVTMANS